MMEQCSEKVWDDEQQCFVPRSGRGSTARGRGGRGRGQNRGHRGRGEPQGGRGGHSENQAKEFEANVRRGWNRGRGSNQDRGRGGNQYSGRGGYGTSGSMDSTDHQQADRASTQTDDYENQSYRRGSSRGRGGHHRGVPGSQSRGREINRHNNAADIPPLLPNPPKHGPPYNNIPPPQMTPGSPGNPFQPSGGMHQQGSVVSQQVITTTYIVQQHTQQGHSNYGHQENMAQLPQTVYQNPNPRGPLRIGDRYGSQQNLGPPNPASSVPPAGDLTRSRSMQSINYQSRSRNQNDYRGKPRQFHGSTQQLHQNQRGMEGGIQESERDNFRHRNGNDNYARRGGRGGRRKNFGAVVARGRIMQKSESLESVSSSGSQQQYEDVLDDISETGGERTPGKVPVCNRERNRYPRGRGRGTCGRGYRRGRGKQSMASHARGRVHDTGLANVESVDERSPDQMEVDRPADTKGDDEVKAKKKNRHRGGKRRRKNRQDANNGVSAENNGTCGSEKESSQLSTEKYQSTSKGKSSETHIAEAISGREGMDSLPLKTLRNRVVRYKQKLAKLKQQEEKDEKLISEWESLILDLSATIQRRKSEEVQMKDDKQDELTDSEEETASEESSDESDYESDNDTVVNSNRIKRRPKVTSSLLKNKMQFKPKRRAPKMSKPSSQVSKVIGATGGNSKQQSSVDKDLSSLINMFGNELCSTSKEKSPSVFNVTEAEQGRPASVSEMGSESGKKRNINQEGKGTKVRQSSVGEDLQSENSKGMKNKQKRGKGRSEEGREYGTPGKERKTTNTDETDAPQVSRRGNRPRSSTSSSTGTEEEGGSKDGPSENEVFKFLVKSMNGFGKPDHILQEMGYTSVNAEEWFRHHPRRFSRFEKNRKIHRVQVYLKEASYCLDYSKWNKERKPMCSKEKCAYFHICKNLIIGQCQYGNSCHFSHDIFDKRNLVIAQNLGLDSLFSNTEILTLLRFRFPHVCETWNNTGSCPEDACFKLHLCKNYIFGRCLQDECPLSHSFKTDHNLGIFQAYKMVGWLEPKNLGMLKRMIFLKTSYRGKEEETDPQAEAQSQREGNRDGMERVAESKEGTPDRETKETESDKRRRRNKNITIRTKYDKVTGGNINSDTVLCAAFLENKCKVARCPCHHNRGKLPYLWQIELVGKWVTLDEDDAVLIEKAFCDLKPRTGPMKVTCSGETFTIRVEFTPQIKGILVESAEGETVTQDIQAHRLSTVSYASEKSDSFAFCTQWRWYWKDDKSKWCAFASDPLQYTLESKYLFGQKTFLYPRDNYRFMYSLDFRDMTQTNMDTGRDRAVIRRPLFVSPCDVADGRPPTMISKPTQLVDVPSGWQPWDCANAFELVDLDPRHQEYNEVDESFYKTMHRDACVVEKIYRVQNPELWSAFCQAESSMSMKAVRAGREPHVNQQKLFHGTDSLKVVQGICVNCFDFRLCGKNATVYGEGAYFAKTAKYSHRYTNGDIRFMFKARVLVGEYTKGEKSLKRPPEKPDTKHELFDSCVDNTVSPSIFIVFERSQSYPEYLIQYRELDQSDLSDYSYQATGVSSKPNVAHSYSSTGHASGSGRRSPVTAGYSSSRLNTAGRAYSLPSYNQPTPVYPRSPTGPSSAGYPYSFKDQNPSMVPDQFMRSTAGGQSFSSPEQNVGSAGQKSSPVYPGSNEESFARKHASSKSKDTCSVQ